MKKQTTMYHIILDRSGSMNDCIQATLSGFKEQVLQVRHLREKFPEQAITLGVSMFNREVEHAYFNEHPNDAVILTEETYRPSGGTALLDAIVLTANRIENTLVRNQLTDNTTVVMVIITDGHENASKHYHMEDVRATIKRLEGSGTWTFNFIGATLDALEVAERMSFKRQNSLRFEVEEMNDDVWASLNNYMDGYMGEKQRRMKSNTPLKFMDVPLENKKKDKES